MTQQEILSRISLITTSPSEVIFSVTMQDILTAIVRRIGLEALTLSTDDLELAKNEVTDAISHNLDIREYIDMGLDSWEVIRKL